MISTDLNIYSFDLFLICNIATFYISADNLASVEEEKGMARLKTMIHQLYTGLNVEEYEVKA